MYHYMHRESGYYEGRALVFVVTFIRFDSWVDLGRLSIPLHELIK